MLFSRRAAAYPEDDSGRERMSRRRSELSGFVCEALQQKLGASSIFNPDTFLFKKEKGGKCIPLFLYLIF
jgi:hypothetical protein